MLLAGDVGGTKTNLAIYPLGAELGVPLVEETFQSALYPNLETLLGAFLCQTDLKIEVACFGVAGPVVAGRVSTTNLPWKVDEGHLRKSLKLSSVKLLNDLQAISQAVPFLDKSDLYALNQGELMDGGAIAVIAPGTGLGEAYLTWDGSRYRPYASEGGHVDFAPTNRLEAELLSFLKDRHGYEHVSYERVCSGLGLPNIYEYLKATGKEEEPGWLAEQLAAADDPNPIIVNTALNKEMSCEICVTTVETFVSILGSEAGNLALKVLATGGVYVGGGIPPRILSFMDDGRFMRAFVRKGRLSEMMSKIPVHIILNPNAALLGAAHYGLELWGADQ